MTLSNMDKYLQRSPMRITLLETEGEFDLTYFKPDKDVHKQICINNFPLNYDVICIIKDYLYYSGIEIKVRKYKQYIDRTISNMWIRQTAYCDSAAYPLHISLAKEAETSQFQYSVCFTCGDYTTLGTFDQYTNAWCECDDVHHDVYEFASEIDDDRTWNYDYNEATNTVYIDTPCSRQLLDRFIR